MLKALVIVMPAFALGYSLGATRLAGRASAVPVAGVALKGFCVETAIRFIVCLSMCGSTSAAKQGFGDTRAAGQDGGVFTRGKSGEVGGDIFLWFVVILVTGV